MKTTRIIYLFQNCIFLILKYHKMFSPWFNIYKLKIFCPHPVSSWYFIQPVLEFQRRKKILAASQKLLAADERDERANEFQQNNRPHCIVPVAARRSAFGDGSGGIISEILRRRRHRRQDRCSLLEDMHATRHNATLWREGVIEIRIFMIYDITYCCGLRITTFFLICFCFARFQKTIVVGSETRQMEANFIQDSGLNYTRLAASWPQIAE